MTKLSINSTASVTVKEHCVEMCGSLLVQRVRRRRWNMEEGFFVISITHHHHHLHIHLLLLFAISIRFTLLSINVYAMFCETNLIISPSELLLLEISSSSSENKKKRVKLGKRPLTYLNPPPHHHQQSSSSLPSSSRPPNYDTVPHFSL